MSDCCAAVTGYHRRGDLEWTEINWAHGSEAGSQVWRGCIWPGLLLCRDIVKASQRRACEREERLELTSLKQSHSCGEDMNPLERAKPSQPDHLLTLLRWGLSF